MDTPEPDAMQINLSEREAAEIAVQVICNNDIDCFALLMASFQETDRKPQCSELIKAAFDEAIKYSTIYSELRDEYVRVVLRKFRSK